MKLNSDSVKTKLEDANVKYILSFQKKINSLGLENFLKLLDVANEMNSSFDKMLYIEAVKEYEEPIFIRDEDIPLFQDALNKLNDENRLTRKKIKLRKKEL